ncbi:DUF262 domain-containing protein [Streptococcus gordonii]|uniref:DUF262 domain-containing protein n=1 Tax=Streptococcus gordonii TaxID=1302 RepID=UPI001EDCA03D|nr:DUF262 domain-containing protein [Streptococcus gordonii]MCG4822863.1 DUF262 domain-containing HNH endonuclease family protein [Streptococcus gordonii]MCG4848149.1 DUF262 domain-containing HNH endonuclease family protein [Streptococcus gordonii]MDE8686063.1 DUF262 domain-containing HNH endonuclease family protein [Streptococcus gordonii]
MRNDIQPALQTVKRYFEKSEFYIPTYQRPYAWQVPQCEQLIEDINLHMENFDENSQDNYFFGAVLIAQETGEEHEVTLIDGQQRTTTFMLLLKAILLKIDKELEVQPTIDTDARRLSKRLNGLKEQIFKMLFNISDDEKDDFVDGLYYPNKDRIKYLNHSISEKYASEMSTILLGKDFNSIKENVHQIYRRQKDNRYTNFYKNFRYFYNMCSELNVFNLINFANHFIDNCQVITITSYNTDQAINIFNSLNGTGVPLNPIEVIVSKTTANASDRKNFEKRWQEIVQRTDSSRLDLNSLITHYIFMKLSEQNGADRRNPGIRAFFSKNKYLLNDDILFTAELDRLIINFERVSDTINGQLINQLNGNLRPFVSSYLFFREDSTYLDYILRLGILIELSELSYSHKIFKGFLEEINLMYSQVDSVSTEDLISKIRNHIHTNFLYDDVKQILTESGISNSLLYVNEYLFALEQGVRLNLEGNIDIEHIMPQSGLNRENIMLDAGFETQEEFREYAEKIGNKILLEADINRGIGDAWFRTKRKNTITSGHGYIGSKFPIAKFLANYQSDTWTREDIDKVTEKAAKRIADFVFER